MRLKQAIFGAFFFSLLVLVVAFYSAQSSGNKSKLAENSQAHEVSKVTDNTNKAGKTDQDLRKILTDEQYRVTQQCGTEPPFTGKYYDFHQKGIYRCVVCGQELFVSDSKYNSGSGWPSFFQPANDSALTEITDTSHGMIRTEIKCSRCGAHLGHVFDDGPRPTGLRYCVNSAALKFEPDSSAAASASDKE